MGKNVVSGFINLMMAKSMREDGLMIKKTESEGMCGIQERFLQEFFIMKESKKASSSGRMGKNNSSVKIFNFIINYLKIQ